MFAWYKMLLWYEYFLGEKSEVLLVFSFYTNGMKLFSCQKSKSSDTIGCLNGIRALSSIYIIFSHSSGMYPKTPLHNLNDVVQVRHTIISIKLNLNYFQGKIFIPFHSMLPAVVVCLFLVDISLLKHFSWWVEFC